MDLITQRNKAMKHAYVWAKRGNFFMAQSWILRANDFWPTTQRQINHANKLLTAYKRRDKHPQNRTNS